MRQRPVLSIHRRREVKCFQPPVLYQRLAEDDADEAKSPTEQQHPGLRCGLQLVGASGELTLRGVNAPMGD